MRTPRLFLHSFVPAWLALAAFLAATCSTAFCVEGTSNGYPQEYRDLMLHILRAFNARDFKKATQLLDEADQVIPSTAIALNTRGAIAIEEHRYVEGAAFCRDALAKDPSYFPARFNLGEIPFMKKDYPEARKIFTALLEEKPKNDVKEMLLFRIFLTYLLEKNEDAASETLDQIHFPGETAAYYFAQSAREFSQGNREKAQGWIRSADWVFSPAKNYFFVEVFYDLGWVKRPDPTAPPKPEKPASSIATPPGLAPVK